jgi:hypothetical protein
MWGYEVLRINRIVVGLLGVAALVAVAMPSTPASSTTVPEILGSGYQFPAGSGDTGFFTMYATGSGNAATGSFTLSQSGWPKASRPFTLRTASVTCVLYNFDGPQTVVTGTVTSGSHTETVVALTFHKDGAVFLRFSFAPNISTVSPGCDAPNQLTGIAIATGDIEYGSPPTLPTNEVLGSGTQSAGGLFAIDTQGTGNTALGNFTFYQSNWPKPTTPSTLRTAKVKCVLISGGTAQITGRVKDGTSSETVVAEAVDPADGGPALRFAFAGAFSKVSKGCDSTAFLPVPVPSGDIEIGS